ncbi:CheR family methyltransferase [Marinibactrum halimedae]|uniref:protein-glutamate O-methyltransferase n=1 Tax=Marinibactrum halimedae TaxID=1444977 RepID=A0AA37WMT1_9GAMM|nr:protein-glutamate O-methyltransferase CheR [Marinibactrum halimedae]MCD9461117.1 protein-glutamate O-methyltransferase CheR [Marinibactrum halimedae]GLS24457.1 chemotaxis protein CheR [Marinibactrum halimedae]
MVFDSSRGSDAASDFKYFRDFLEEVSGISLADNKQYLVTTRIRRIMQDNNLTSVRSMVDMMRSRSNHSLRDAIVDAMTTNETFWFRDSYPFQYLTNTLLPELSRTTTGSLRIWSAACSSGQEPYSLSMALDEYERLKSMGVRKNVEIVATDLSPSMLERCKQGRYDRLEIVRGLSPERLKQYFKEVDGGEWQLIDTIRRRVQFRSLNLMESYGSLGKFHIIFCRNVLIYFTPDLKRDILQRLHGALQPGGILFLGASEGLAGTTGLFEMVQCKPGIAYRAI